MRIGIFVDVASQFDALAFLMKGCRIDYGQYWKFIEKYSNRPTEIVSALAYGFQSNNEAEPFIYKLKSLGYTPKFITVEPQNKPNRNIEIAIDILQMKSRLDIVVLGSNSPEFIPLIDHLYSIGIQVYVVAVGLTHDYAAVNIELTKIPHMFIRKSNENGTT